MKKTQSPARKMPKSNAASIKGRQATSRQIEQTRQNVTAIKLKTPLVDGGFMKNEQEITNGEHEMQRIADEMESLKRDLDELERMDAGTTPKQLQTMVKQLIEIVDARLTRSAFNFYPVPGSGKSNLPELWPESWMRSFDPSLAANEKRVERYELFLDAAFSGKDTDRNVVSGLSNAISNLKTEHSTLGFYVGVLVGAKMMGASKEHLEQFGEHLVDVLT